MPDISVAMSTYNHQNYIRQAIESVLNQQTDYSFEIVIGEDCSTDNTRAIVREYAEKYPEKVKLLSREKNLGPTKNIVDVLRHCTGRYLAFLEGDDYWNSELKLQTQADFLEKNAGYASCFSDVKLVDALSGVPLRENNFRNFDVLDYTSLCAHWYIAINTVVMRNVFTEYYFAQMLKSNFIGDRIILTIAIKHGAMKYLDLCLGVYRVRVPGSFSSRSFLTNLKDAVSAHTVIYDLVDDGYEKEAALSDLRRYASWAKHIAGEGEKAYKCPVCENELLTFYIEYSYLVSCAKEKHNIISSDTQGHICPFCDSGALERHLVLYLKRLDFFAAINSTTAILHIAPEKILQSIFKQLTESYTAVSLNAADKDAADVTYRNIRDGLLLPFADNCFDIIMCNNVFDCIEDDETAMRELYRVLKKGGCAIFQTDYSPGMPGSLQYRVNTPEQRIRCYGDEHIVRIYGTDLFDKLRKAGFEVNLVKHGSVFSEGEASYYGVNEKEDLIMCFKD